MTRSEARKLEWANPDVRNKRIKNMTGWHQSEKIKKRISIAQKGRKKSKEHILKLSLSNIGKKASLETRLKMSKVHKERGTGKWMQGKKLSEETKRKIGLVNLGKKYSDERRKHISESLKGKTWDILGREKKDPILMYENRLYHNRKRRVSKLNAEGSHTLQEWKLLKEYYQYMCLCCKRQEPEITLTEDHIVPLFMGGSDYIDNIQPLCGSCNSRKHTKTIDYRARLEEIERTL